MGYQEKNLPSEEQLVEDIKNEAKESLYKTMWEGYANDIITGIQNNNGTEPDRAIWELVQNARDVSLEDGKAEIVFTRRENNFEFQHNGQPFTRNSIQALILQTSSKVRRDIVQVGQYGTGFLTTHKFGLRYRLSGSLKLLNGKQFYNFNSDDLLIDRTDNEKTALSKKLGIQIDTTQEWGVDVSKHSSIPNPHTVFTYLHDHAVEHENVEKAFRTSPTLAPYVLALNKYIQSIVFLDEVDQSEESYSFISNDKESESGDCILNCVSISHKKTGESDEIIYIYLLHSKSELEDQTGESKVTVILPIKKNENGIIEVYSFDEHIPQLFLYLPLLGSKNWGFNFLIHAPQFTCDKDSRDSLLFVGNGQNNEEQASENRDLISLANKLIRNYLDVNYMNFANAKYLAKAKFRVSQPSEPLSEYYQSLQTDWVNYFEQMKLVEKTEPKDNILVESIRVLDKEMYIACTNDLELLDALYSLLSKIEHNLTIPEKKDMVYWSRITDEWYDGKENSHVIKLENIVELIEKTTISNDDLVWLHKLCKYFKDNNHDAFFLKNIVPNEALVLRVQKDLVKPISFNQTLYNVLKVLTPEEVDKFVHATFVDIVDESVNSFGDEQIKKALTEYTTNLPTKSEIIKNTIIAGQKVDPTEFEGGYIPAWKVHAILDLYKMLLPEDGTGFTSKIFKSLTDYYNYYPTTNERISKDIFDIRNCYNPLINDSLLHFTLNEDKSLHKDWCYKMVIELKKFSEANNFLRNYQVYPNQKNAFKYAQQLKKEEAGIPKRLKEIFDFIRRSVTEENDTNSIRHELVDPDYIAYFIGENELKGRDLSEEIEEPFENGAISIDKNPHQSLYIEIIKNISETGEGLKWKQLFPTINGIRATLMISVITSPKKKESIFKLISVQDEEKLKTISDLSERDDITELITCGESALTQKRHEEYIKMLGDFVEKHIQTYLIQALEGLNINVLNQQGGQDYLISKEGYEDYHVEVKSRCATIESIEMSSLQFSTAVENPTNFALVTVDMTQFDRTRAENNEDVDYIEMNHLIRVVTNIGGLKSDLNKRMTEAFKGEEDEIRARGSYTVIVPQASIKAHYKNFENFVAEIKLKFK